MQGWTKVWIAPSGASSGTLVERIASARGIAPSELAKFLEPTWSDLRPLEELPGAREVGQRLAQAVREKKHIAIFGDYDADGMCASAILVHLIRAARPESPPTVYIPQRATDPYGLSMKALTDLASRGVQVVVTVDCGITAIDEAAQARRLGIELLITDHHPMRGDGVLPDAAVIAHPSLSSTNSPLCGSAVAWKVGWAFACAWCQSEKVSPVFRTLLAETLALAAIATIADVVPLGGDAARENRTIVRLGAARIASSGLPGLRALAIEAGISHSDVVDAERISFGIAPIINACGRLGNPIDAVKLLGMSAVSSDAEAVDTADAAQRADTARRARVMAANFGLLNAARKKQEREIVDAAKGRIDEGLGHSRGACVLAAPNWKRGIVGIACARLSDLFNVPVVLLESDGEFAYGSARSVVGYSVLEGLHACKDLLDHYGGHAAAAGLMLRVERIDEFREKLSAHAASSRAGAGVPPLHIDAQLCADDLSVAVVESVAKLGPFGMGFPAPLFLVRDAVVTRAGGVFGAEADHLNFHVKLSGANSSDEVRCTWWRQAVHYRKIGVGMTVQLLVRAQVDRWKGPPRPAFTIMDMSDAPWSDS